MAEFKKIASFKKEIENSIPKFFSKITGKTSPAKKDAEVSSLFKGAPHRFDFKSKLKFGRFPKIILQTLKSKLTSFTSLKGTSYDKSGLVGLDIGSRYLKLAHIQSKLGAKVLSCYRIEELPLEEVDPGRRTDVLSDIISRLKKEGLLRGPVVCAFTDDDLTIDVLRFPRMPTAELHSAVEWAMKEQSTIAVDLDKAVLDFSVIGQVEIEGEKKQEVLVVTTSKKSVLRYLNVLTEAGIDVIAIEPPQLGFFESLEINPPWKEGDVIGLLDIGAKVTNFEIIVANAVHFTRSIGIAGDLFTQSIADYCMMEKATAEEWKKRVGMSRMVLEEDRRVKELEQDERVKMAHALGLQLEQFLTELDRSFKYFSMELSGSSIQKMDKILIGGGGGLLKNLGDFLSYRLKIPVEVIDPLRSLEVDDSRIERKVLQEVAPQLCVSIGLALRK